MGDYSQIEYRLLAYFSQDPILLDAYRNDRDLHKEVGLLLVGPNSGLSDNEIRAIGKSLNFAIVYGAGPDKVAAMTGRTREEAEVFIGLKGLRTAYEKLLKGKTKKDEFLYFYLHEEEYAKMSDDFYNSIKQLTMKVNVRGIANKKYEESWFAKRYKFLNVRFVNFPIPGNIDIAEEMVLFVSWKPNPIGVLIHSKNITDNLRNYFNEVWSKGK